MMYCTVSEIAKVLEHDENGIYYACKMVLNCIFLFVNHVVQCGAYVFWLLLIWLHGLRCNLNMSFVYAYVVDFVCCVYFEICIFDKRNYAYAVLKNRMNLCMFEIVHSFMKIKIPPFFVNREKSRDLQKRVN